MLTKDEAEKFVEVMTPSEIQQVGRHFEAIRYSPNYTALQEAFNQAVEDMVLDIGMAEMLFRIRQSLSLKELH